MGLGSEAFAIPEDICNTALKHLGSPRITSLTDNSKQAAACQFWYDKDRQAEMRRNVWRFGTRKAALRPVSLSTMLLVPPTWNSTTLYLPGMIVADPVVAGVYWQSSQVDNLNNTPGPDNNYYWDTYVGPLTVYPYDPSTAYYTGELVYKAKGDGAYQVFTCIQQMAPSDILAPMANIAGQTPIIAGVYPILNGICSAYPMQSDPNVRSEWQHNLMYRKDSIVSYKWVMYRSLVDINIGNAPDAALVLWVIGTTYPLGAIVGGSDGFNYQSIVGANVGNNPVTDGGIHWKPLGVPTQKWTTASVGVTSSIQWLALPGATLQNVIFNWPQGSGPVEQSASRNVYRLPNGYLREAPQDPKAGSTSFLGAPSGLMYNDWEYEGNYFTTRDSEPIIYRFCADLRNVPIFDSMFCQGLGCRLAVDMCEELTQSADKIQRVEALYKGFMGEARVVNGIETGPTEPPVDDYISCRL